MTKSDSNLTHVDSDSSRVPSLHQTNVERRRVRLESLIDDHDHAVLLPVCEREFLVLFTPRFNRDVRFGMEDGRRRWGAWWDADAGGTEADEEGEIGDWQPIDGDVLGGRRELGATGVAD